MYSIKTFALSINLPIYHRIVSRYNMFATFYYATWHLQTAAALFFVLKIRNILKFDFFCIKCLQIGRLVS